MKTANFDVTHELDEFLMVEKPLTHSKRRINADLDKLKPELRQLEEQCVPFHNLTIPSFLMASDIPDLRCTISPDRNGNRTTLIISR